ncbi:SAM-dependent methyltransferase [Amycolatopsis jiangsuensis]|uniref:SAM-dependent methyltransferase n=1 Tax=Amycolatopsis jiangsuensis TaxID=1181879 RepID=A0A840J6H0_9PSEU|nr:methyltransferase domain-containing protein [Amycolatopsis jiangsuensis]MBB4689004.1 SAM-dependent methyltransferase [Amycolatopsis jiangsuensis]
MAEDGGVERIQAAMAARSAVRGWSTGAELLALLRAAHDAGWLSRLRNGATAAELAGSSGIAAGQVTDALSVLGNAEVAQAHEDYWLLTPAFAALVDGVAGIELPAVLAAVDLSRSEIARVAEPVRRLGGADALTLAEDSGLRVTAGTQTLFGLIHEALPEFRELLEKGGPLLDVGSGVGGFLLTTTSLFDRLHAVGVEVVEEVAAELRSRAHQAGLAERVEIRTLDARELTDEGTFAASFWAQPFFAAEARPGTLAAIRRAVRPGGLLLMQELFPPLTEQAGSRDRLDQLFHRRQGATFGRSAEELAAEAVAAGFRDPEIVETPLGRLVAVRR